MDPTIARVRFQAKSLFAIAVLVIIGLLCLVASLKLQVGFWQALFGQLSTALLISGVWAGFYELSIRGEFIRINDENRDLLFKNLSLARVEQTLGLSSVADDTYTYDFGPLLENSRDLQIVLNDGRTWISRHSEVFRQRLADKTKTTTVFVLHPDSEMLGVLARKVGTTSEKLKEKIAETVQMLRDLRKQDSQLKIYGHQLYNPHSTFVGDNIAVVTLYMTARGRTNVPAFTFKDTGDKSFVRKLKSDLQDLLNDSAEISAYAVTKVTPTPEHKTP